MFPFNNVILASKSPRRRDLLKQIGISFSIEISGIDESIPLDLPPILMAEYLSKEKAKKIGIDVDYYVDNCEKTKFENFMPWMNPKDTLSLYVFHEDEVSVIPDGCSVDALASKAGLIPGVFNSIFQYGICVRES